MGAKQDKATSTKKHAAELTEEEIQMLLKNTHFNRKQIVEWHSGFIVNIFFLSVSISLKFILLKFMRFNSQTFVSFKRPVKVQNACNSRTIF